METMTSRQRVLNAIEHKTVDRMPIDLGMHFSTGISAYAYHNLREYLGMSTDQIEMIDCVQGLARVDNDILDRFHVDTILLNPGWPQTHIWNPRGNYSFHVPTAFQPEAQKDGSFKVTYQGETMYCPAGGYFFDGAWPNFYGLNEKEYYDLFAKRAQYIYEETDKFTIMMGFSGFFGDMEFACNMLLEPEMVQEENEAALARQIEKFDFINKKMGKYINAIEINSDLGTQTSALCSPASYEECCYPYLKRFCRHVHETSDIKLFMHSCGSIALMLPYIVDAGVDILNPVQISAAGMDPKFLKETYGDKLCFWGGGCNTQSILNMGTVEDVRNNVKELVEIFKPGSGFVFNQVHNIMGDVKPENIVAMLDTAYENSWY